jgi:hypothetical protein
MMTNTQPVHLQAVPSTTPAANDVCTLPDKVLPFALMHPRYVTIEWAAALIGLTPPAIRAKIARGDWVEGRQFHRRDGRVFVDLKGYERWVEGQA